MFFRDSPVVQGNSILALSGLAAVLAKYESNLPADSDGSLGVRYLTFDVITDLQYAISVIVKPENFNFGWF